MPPGSTPSRSTFCRRGKIELVGAFRAHDEFRLAVDLIVRGVIDVSPILSGTYPLDQAATALDLAGDRARIVKLHLALGSRPDAHAHRRLRGIVRIGGPGAVLCAGRAASGSALTSVPACIGRALVPDGRGGRRPPPDRSPAADRLPVACGNGRGALFADPG